jgi:hypothetical protein
MGLRYFRIDGGVGKPKFSRKMEVSVKYEYFSGIVSNGANALVQYYTGMTEMGSPVSDFSSETIFIFNLMLMALCKLELELQI